MRLPVDRGTPAQGFEEGVRVSGDLRNRGELKGSRPTFYPYVDILRGFAAVSVLVYHVIEYWSWTAFPHDGPLAWFRIGWLGVDLFFVISGFVIGLSALAGIDRVGAKGFRAPFWRRRLVRILPLYYLTCLVFVVLLMPGPWGGDFVVNVLTHGLFIHNVFPSTQGALNAPNWSLGIEMQFYLLMLLIAPWLRGCKGWWLLAGMTATAWLWRHAAFRLMSPLPQGGEESLWLATVQLPGTLDEFAAGLLLARFIRGARGQNFLALMARRPATLLLVAGAAALSLWSAFLIYWSGPSFWHSAATVTLVRTPLAIAAALSVLMACTPASARWLRVSAPLRYLGTISYGIYLWHWPVLVMLRNAGVTRPEDGLILTAAISLSLAAMSWHFFEKPIIRHFGRLPRGNG